MQVHTLLQVGQFVSEFTLGSCGMRQTVLNILIHTKVRNKVVSWWLGWFSESSTCPLTKLVLSALSMSKTILNIVVSAKVRNWVTCWSSWLGVAGRQLMAKLCLSGCNMSLRRLDISILT